MDLSIGPPNTLAHRGPLMIEWSRRAEERGFFSLGTIDRIVYPCYDSLTSLAVAAGATSRIRLLSGILLAPPYPAAWLAKAAASLDAMSGGRLTLGLGVGGRADDFEVMGRSLNDRGRAMDEALEVLRQAWSVDGTVGEQFPINPAPATVGRLPVLIGGTSDAAVRRTVQYAQGWIAGGGGPESAAPMIAKVRQAWQKAGREGSPRIAALAYFGLGDDTASAAALRTYYGVLGPAAELVAASALRSPQAVRDAVKAFADVGVDELVLDPTIAALDQVDRLADIVR